MGAETSQTSTAPLARSPVFQNMRDYPSFGHFYVRELVTLSCNPPPVRKFVPSITTVHHPQAIVDMMVNCTEQIMNFRQVCEAIIGYPDNKDESYIELLKTSFDEYIRLYNAREAAIAYAMQHRFTNIPSFSFALKQEITFDKIFEAFKDSYQLVLKKEVKSKVIDEVTEFFQDSIPPSAFPPPMVEFTYKGSWFDILESGGKISAHSITSDGNFLFVLTKIVLYIYPLSENGACVTIPMRRKIPDNISLTDAVNIHTDKNNLYILDTGVKYSWEVRELLKMEMDEKLRFEPKSGAVGGFVLSNGITTVNIDASWKATYKYGDSTISSELKRSKVRLDPNYPYLFPKDNTHKDVPIVTNGHYIGFMYQGPASSIFRIFSLESGDFLIDVGFQYDAPILAATIDVINKCYYIIVPFNNNRVIVKRILFLGSDDPSILDLSHYDQNMFFQKRLKKFVKNITPMMSAFLGSQIIPRIFIPRQSTMFEQLVDLINQFLTLPSNVMSSAKDSIISIVQSLISVLQANLILIQQSNAKIPVLIQKLFDLLTSLPTNLAVSLFFSNTEFFFFYNHQYSVVLLVKLIKERIQSRALFNFVLHKLENSHVLATIPFNASNSFTELIPQNLSSINSSQEAVLRLLIIHQRVLLSYANKRLKEDPFAEVSYATKSKTTQPNELDNFGDYFQILASKFDTAISMAQNANEFQESLIFMLFDNFIRLISPLVEYHSIARIMTALLSALLAKLSEFIRVKVMNLDLYPKIGNFVLTLLFTFGKFSATLFKGGGQSEFESKCMWIMRANMDIIDHEAEFKNLDSPDINIISNEKLREFVTADPCPQLEKIYLKHKAIQNKKLTPQYKELDKIVMLGVCKHMGILDELMDFKGTLSPELKKAADVMMKIRSTYRQHNQNEKPQLAEDLKIRALMLLRLESEFLEGDVKETLITDYLNTDFAPILIKNIVRQQRTRIQTTLVGFSLIDNTYQMQIHPLLNDIIAYTLSCIESFEGLSVIMKITKMTPQQNDQINKFFQRVLVMIEQTHNNRFLLLALRFFRDIENVEEIHTNFLASVLGLLEKDPTNERVFALAFSLISRISRVEPCLMNPRSPLIMLALAAEAFKKLEYSDQIFDTYAERLFNAKNPLEARAVGRVITQLMNCPISSRYEAFFKRIIQIIGTAFATFSNLDIASELVHICRDIINRKLFSNEVLTKVIESITPESDLYMVAGVFAMLSNFLEPIRPFGNVRYHADLTTSTEVIAIPQKQPDTYVIYQKPFSLNEAPKTVQVIKPAFIYAVPFIQVNPRLFTKYEYIMSFWDSMMIKTKFDITVQCLYVQAFVHFLKEPEFLKLINVGIVDRFSVSPVPFGNIIHTIETAYTFLNKPTLPENNGFSTMTFKDAPTISYLSPQIRPDTIFSVTVSTKNDRLRGYLGICSDSVEGYMTRYSFVELPSGKIYPSLDDYEKLKPAQSYTMYVDMREHKFTIGSNEYPFPYGKKFRVIFACNKAMDHSISYTEDPFDKHAFPPLAEHAALSFHHTGTLFQPPTFLDNQPAILPSDPNTIPKGIIDVNPVSYKERLRRNFVTPQHTILIHPQFATAASKPICIDAFRGLIYALTCQWMTIGLVRIGAARPELITNEEVIVKLFSILSVLLEQFFPNEYRVGKFMFSLSEPIWNEKATTNLLYLSLDVEAKAAMLALSKRADVPAAVAKCIYAMCNDPLLHLVAYPNRWHSYYPPGSNIIAVKTRGSSIVTINSFTGAMPGFFSIGNNRYGSPLIIPAPMEIKLNVNQKAYAVSTLEVLQMDNSWVFETPFEMLILLKSLIYMANTHETQIIAKNAVIDSIVAQSPFIISYLPQFLELLQVTIPSTPITNDIEFTKKMLLFGSQIQKMPIEYKDRYLIVYQQEQRVMSSDVAKDFASNFPEFFNTKIPSSMESTLMIPQVPLDPGAITKDILQHIMTIRLFARRYNSLIGFPFWEILPIWYRASGYYKGQPDYIKPTLSQLSPILLRLANPSHVRVTIKFNPQKNLPAEAAILRSKTDSFEEIDYIPASSFRDELVMTDEMQFFSIISIPNGWLEFKPMITYRNEDPNQGKVIKQAVNVDDIHAKFIEDMKDFAIRWDDDDTDTLLNILPRNSLMMPTFTTVKSICEQCSLMSRFPPSVVYLKALLIHHFNYLKSNFRNQVPEPIWESLNKFVSCEDASEQFVKTVTSSREFLEFTIDRHSAHRIIMDEKGDRRYSVIHQIAEIYKANPPTKFRCGYYQPRVCTPWRVHFAGEEAIDASGPMRELFTEIAASIFEKTSCLTFQTPNGRHNTGELKDVFVPYENTGGRFFHIFKGIGIYLGMVVRTGYAQDIPFVPFVFKFLAGGELNSNDILQCDKALADQFAQLRKAEADGDFQRVAVPWKIEQWDGTQAMIPGHSADATVGPGEVENFCSEAINFRINSIRPTLSAMRDGFIENVVVDHHPLLTSARLSHMIQGSSVITTQQLRSICEVKDYKGLEDKNVRWVFSAIERFNPEQRRMFLKFVTTHTRLPNSSINSAFKLKIDRLERQNPDESLPTASTCFNLLHLPQYSSENITYQKLLVAIQYCQTMELR